jgi:hypothetical protein
LKFITDNFFCKFLKLSKINFINDNFLSKFSNSKTNFNITSVTQRIWKPPSTKNQWSVPENRRAFFDNFAASKNFSPLVAENWYNVTVEEVSQKVQKREGRERGEREGEGKSEGDGESERERR